MGYIDFEKISTPHFLIAHMATQQQNTLDTIIFVE